MGTTEPSERVKTHRQVVRLVTYAESEVKTLYETLDHPGRWGGSGCATGHGFETTYVNV